MNTITDHAERPRGGTRSRVLGLLGAVLLALGATATVQFVAQEPAFAGDGCTIVPDYVFLEDCNEHDYCYTGEPGLYRSECDSQFLDNMEQTCVDTFAWYDPERYGCDLVAESYYVGVRAGGWAFWGGPDYLND